MLPQFRVFRSRVPGWFGHDAISIGPVSFFRRFVVSRALLRHEQRHVQQWYAGALLGAGLVLALPVSAWWLLAAPLVFPALYLAGLLIWGYAAHPAERDARRYALRDD